MKLIRRMWLSYEKNVMPKDAELTQMKETRQAFYSGAAVLFAILTGKEFLDDHGDIEPTEMDLQKMNDIQEEVDVFGAELDLELLGIRKH